MLRTTLRRTFLLVTLTAVSSACAGDAGEADTEPAPEEEEPELARYMADLQRWSHKTALSVETRNAGAAEFYLHEMEEAVEAVREEAPTYEGHPVGDLTEEMLAPAVAALDSAVDERAWTAVDERVRGLARACNQCHASTGYGFVRIDLRDPANPYAQRFDTAASGKDQ